MMNPVRIARATTLYPDTPVSRQPRILVAVWASAAVLALTACGGGERATRGDSCSGRLTVAGDPALAAALPFNIYAPGPADDLNAQEAELYEALMRHRETLGLPRVPLSRGLTLVAGRHAMDTSVNILGKGGQAPGSNSHSWSDAPYPADHSRPEVMWEAPRRLNSGYCATAYEISADGFPEMSQVVDGWLASSGHAPVIENTGPWRGKDWKAVGVGVAPATTSGPPVYHVWFAETPDPGGAPDFRP
ncbi:hypothetical protein DKT77_18935 [Meridianimarinicoccus roseus]|uniref:CAP domain-containing protein n=1 Tax=Meridianimarinicoccus roseus TaxID=2072018 RepID=A0A2V2LCN8_9RHOB|nr:CAP domain-containing protein [Meridianimarinicoccus roseus]PWR01017.1 hypothetical protein DKT77_18935 [Meridianimarinicoccus roseus]